ncbi:MAG: class I SAM-dependent methyltransferase [Dehalococcoidales bacterium]|nr:class I SAM-dependent methyltransferase [Dehalococcoidales bacterium]
MVTRAKNKMKDRGIYLLCDITNIPIKKESMDSVVSLHTLYHVPLDQQKKALNEIYRVLRPESTGVIVYSWGSTSILMKVNFLHDLYCAVKKIILNLFGGKKEIELSKDNILKEPKLYYRVHNFKWFIENINIKFKFELGSWRSVDVKFLKFFIHDFLFGRLILRIIFRLEEVFPKFFGRYGQYPILILKK